MKARRLWTAGVILALALVLCPARIAQATNYYVGNAFDDGDGSLRHAIENANAHPGADVIRFNIPGAWAHTIPLASPLPTLNDPTGGTTIDGYWQSGSSPAVGAAPATIMIRIDGVGAGTGTANNTVTGNFVGINSFGSTHLENAFNGVVISGGAQWNTIGPGNVISGNHQDGISIVGTGSANNVVAGNIIGLNTTGAAEVKNHRYGILLSDSAQNNTVGGDTAAERNVISSNGSYGVYITGASVTGNIVSGNIIGSDANATADLGNLGMGVTIRNGAQNNLIGGDVAAEANFIAHNGHGVWIRDAGTNGNTVSYNAIAAADFHGVYVALGAQYNTIGPFNTIAQNWVNGVYIEGATTRGNVVTRNSIYANGQGISLDGGANNAIPTPGIANITLGGGAVNIVGKSCVACTVEVFTNHDNDGEGETYLGTTAADGSGWFTMSVSSLYHTYVTVTSTRAGDGTSEFSTPYTCTFQAILLPDISRNP